MPPIMIRWTSGGVPRFAERGEGFCPFEPRDYLKKIE